MKLSREEFDKGFQKLLGQFQPRLSKDTFAAYRDAYYEAVEEVSDLEWALAVKEAVRESKYMPKPAEIHTIRKRQLEAEQHRAHAQRKEKPWSESPQMEAYRKSADQFCRECWGQGWVASQYRPKVEPIGRTVVDERDVKSLWAYPCKCLGANTGRKPDGAEPGMDGEEIRLRELANPSCRSCSGYGTILVRSFAPDNRTLREITQSALGVRDTAPEGATYWRDTRRGHPVYKCACTVREPEREEIAMDALVDSPY